MAAAMAAVEAELKGLGIETGEEITGIKKRLADLRNEIDEIDGQIDAIDRQMDEIDGQMDEIDGQMDEIEGQINCKRGEIDAAKHAVVAKKLELYREKDRLLDGHTELFDGRNELFDGRKEHVAGRKELVARQTTLRESFLFGRYYALTSDYWQVAEIEGNKDTWVRFNREISGGDAVPFGCRYRSKDADANRIEDPYELTRKGALSGKYHPPPPEAVRNSTIPESEAETRDAAVWPTDIFGNPASSQDIAHLLPAAPKEGHMDWLNVATAVLGLETTTTDMKAKHKAARGHYPEGKARPKKKQKGKMIQRVSMTGVVHFVSNKIRLDHHKHYLDGPNPKCLIVPVMTLERAENWRGEAYKAICIMGYPVGSALAAVNDGSGTWYKEVQLNGEALLQNEVTRDATPGELELARSFLEEAVIALRDMIANLTLADISATETLKKKKSPLASAQEEATADEDETNQKRKCRVPRAKAAAGHRKPVCLLTFGNGQDNDKHPAPDPLLLVLKAANVWGIMTGKKMLGNGPDPDDCNENKSLGDVMAEERFLEAREQALRPNSREDLARGLGQQNGYCSS